MVSFVNESFEPETSENFLQNNKRLRESTGEAENPQRLLRLPDLGLAGVVWLALWENLTAGDFLDDPVVKNLPATAGDMHLIHGPGRFHVPWGNVAYVPQLLSLPSRAHEPHAESTCHNY